MCCTDHHQADPCLFLLKNQHDALRGVMICHVDDLLIATSIEDIDAVQKSLSQTFPITTWEEKLFEYTGSTIKQEDGIIDFYQTSYVNSRLETVELLLNVCPEDFADQVTKQDNMSTIGALSWLSAQSRPDLQAGVSLAQRKQRNPTYQDVKDTK